MDSVQSLDKRVLYAFGNLANHGYTGTAALGDIKKGDYRSNEVKSYLFESAVLRTPLLGDAWRLKLLHDGFVGSTIESRLSPDNRSR